MTRADWLLFGERLRRQRNSLGLTQEYMAEQLGISVRYYQMLEQGPKGVSVETLIKLSDILSLSIDYLLFGESARPTYLSTAMEGLTPGQQEDAAELLSIFIRACKAPKDDT